MNATTFETLGLGTLLPTSCTVSEELNGIYELELEHHYDASGKWQNIENNRILYASTPRGMQPFRIYKIEPTMDSITVYAQHVYFDLLDNYIDNITTDTATPAETLQALVNQMDYDMGFSFATNLGGTGSVSLERVNPITVLFGEEDGGSFLDSFGGELVRDGWNISILANAGEDRGFVISYGKNLVGLEVEEDISDVKTRIYGLGDDDVTTSGCIDSDHIGDYPYPKIYCYEDTDCTTASELETAIEALYEAGIDLPSINISVDFQLLSNTVEYEKYAILEEVFLGDTVTVRNEKMNFEKKAEVIAYEWDCLLEQYNSIELGDFVDDITTAITKGEMVTTSAEKAVTTATIVSSKISGKVTITTDSIYVTDNSNYANATKGFKIDVTDGIQRMENGVWTTVIDVE